MNNCKLCSPILCQRTHTTMRPSGIAPAPISDGWMESSPRAVLPRVDTSFSLLMSASMINFKYWQSNARTRREYWSFRSYLWCASPGRTALSLGIDPTASSVAGCGACALRPEVLCTSAFRLGLGPTAQTDQAGWSTRGASAVHTGVSRAGSGGSLPRSMWLSAGLWKSDPRDASRPNWTAMSAYLM